MTDSRRVGYKYRLYPTDEQAKQLGGLFGATRVVFNDFAARRQELLKNGEREGFNDTRNYVLVKAKTTPEREWLKEYSSVALQSSVANAVNGYLKFFKELKKKDSGKKSTRRISPPKFKSKRGKQSATFRDKRFVKNKQLNSKWSETNVPMIGYIKYRDTRDLPAQPKSMTISKEANGEYYVSFQVEETLSRENVAIPHEQRKEATGADLGVSDISVEVSTDGTRRKSGNPRHLKNAERRLAAAQKELSRKKRGSKRRSKQKRIVAKQYKNVANKRADYLRKLAFRLSSENQVLALESLNVSGMVKNRRLAKSLSDASLRMLVDFIEEAAVKQFTEVRRIGQFEPTTRTCAPCRTNSGEKPLSVREWQCPKCGAWLDRDFNAAVNVLIAAGLAEILNARGGNLSRELAGLVSASSVEARTSAIV